MNTNANQKRARFAEAVLRGHTAKDAAILAGYSAATAATAGCRLMKHPEVQAELSRQRAELAKTEPRYDDPLQFLQAVASGATYATRLQVRAAIALLPYCHYRK